MIFGNSHGVTLQSESPVRSTEVRKSISATLIILFFNFNTLKCRLLHVTFQSILLLIKHCKLESVDYALQSHMQYSLKCIIHNLKCII